MLTLARRLRPRTKIQSSAENNRKVFRPSNARCIFQHVIGYFVGKYRVCSLISLSCVVAHGNVPLASKPLVFAAQVGILGTYVTIDSNVPASRFGCRLGLFFFVVCLRWIFVFLSFRFLVN